MKQIQALLGAIVVSGVLLFVGAVHPLTVGASSPVAEEVLAMVNAERASAGAGPVVLCDKLMAAAQRHAEDMVANDFFSHRGSDGSRSWDRIRDAGYDWNFTGENIARGYASANSVMSAWMGSNGHRANILDGRFQHMGLYLHPTGNHWVQTFAGGDECDNALPGDTNGDDLVTPSDAIYIVNRLGDAVTEANSTADSDGDNDIDADDFNAAVAGLGATRGGS